jgi:hypothetical protein
MSPAGDEFEWWADEAQSAGKGGKADGADSSEWDEPDMSVLRLRRREPPSFALEVLGDEWGQWVIETADAAAAPVDYCIMPLLAVVSTLIGHARWAEGVAGWSEPPHLWCGSVGDSGTGKSPGADCLFRDVVPVLEASMIGDYPERFREWQAKAELDEAAKRNWQRRMREAQGVPGMQIPDAPIPTASDIAPERPRLRQSDTTIEQIASILATAAPKGCVFECDELSGWYEGLTSYNKAGRAFWLKAYGGRYHSVERRKHSQTPIEVQRLALALCGGIQPDRLATMFTGPDDGLVARILWSWPNPIPFRLGRNAPRAEWAINALERLRELDLQPGNPPFPLHVPMVAEGQELLEEFGRDIQARSEETGGLLRSAYGKARGVALRLSLILEYLCWCGRDGADAPPSVISLIAFEAAAALTSGYFLAMAARVYSDAGATETERFAATLARWVYKEKPPEVYVRYMVREIRLPGLRTAALVKQAADALVEADWLKPPPKGTVYGQPRPRIAYPVNPRLFNR